MGDIKELPKNPCAICRKNEATQLCDFVTGYSWTSLKDDNGVMIGHTYDTCDLPMCKECAKNTRTHDFCPYHHKMLDVIQNPDATLRKRTTEYQVKQMREQGYM